MTKQDQINEMTLAVPQTIVAYDANPKGQHLYGEQRRQIAVALYDVGYRKIDEDTVMLSKEEYTVLANEYKSLEIMYNNLCDKYRLCKDANETLEQNVIIVRKETAKEILSRIKLYATDSKADLIVLINEIAEANNIEVKE